MFVVALVVMPTMYVNTVEGVLRPSTARLVEMGRVYRFSRGLLAAARSICRASLRPPSPGSPWPPASSVRAVVLAEVLAATSGIGHAFARASSFLDTPQLFAWVLVLLALMAAHRVRRSAARPEAGHALAKGAQ